MCVILECGWEGKLETTASCGYWWRYKPSRRVARRFETFSTRPYSAKKAWRAQSLLWVLASIATGSDGCSGYFYARCPG